MGFLYENIRVTGVLKRYIIVSICTIKINLRKTHIIRFRAYICIYPIKCILEHIRSITQNESCVKSK